jgi:hypothetical protein
MTLNGQNDHTRLSVLTVRLSKLSRFAVSSMICWKDFALYLSTPLQEGKFHAICNLLIQKDEEQNCTEYFQDAIIFCILFG